MINELITELQLPAYAGMTDEQATTSLNARTRTRDREVIPSWEVVGAIRLQDFTPTGVTTKHVQYLTLLVSGGQVNVKDPEVRAAVGTIFAGTQTLTNLQALQTESISRAEELGFSRPVEIYDVIEARRIINNG